MNSAAVKLNRSTEGNNFNVFNSICLIMRKYNIIYADPAWEYSKGVYQKFRPINQGKDRLINDFYKTMPMSEMKLLPIQNISEKDCALFMWFTYSHFDKALELCDAWGFKYKTIAFVWLKMSCNAKVLSNIGAWTMGNTESVLIATRGNMLQHKKRNDIKQIVMPNTNLRKRGGNRHSQKPNEVRERIELLFGDVPKVELFARNNYDGWDAWGNEVENSINIYNPVLSIPTMTQAGLAIQNEFC